MKLYPSIASADPLALREMLTALNDWPFLHIDIEDGNFTPNITFGLKTLKSIAQFSNNKQIDVHLMCSDPCRYLENLEGYGIHSVSAHIEALPYPMVFINKAHHLGLQAGLALNIKTPFNIIEPFLPILDFVLAMTAEPDECNEKLYLPVLGKSIELAAKLPRQVELFVDGGLNGDALNKLRATGISGAVLGRLIFDQKNPLSALIALSKD